MTKKAKQWLIKAVLMLTLLQPVVVSADLPSAITYLKAHPQDAWTTQALIAAGETSINTDHLQSVSGSQAVDYAKAILGLTAAGKNPSTFGSVDYVAKLKTYFNNNQIGDESLLNDDAWSILALSSADEEDTDEVTSAKNFLLSHQNVDGGWSYAVNGDSDTNDTAAVLMALVEAGISTDNDAIKKAVIYLHNAQNDDGGFGWMTGSTSDSGSDAWAISAIYKIGQQPTDWEKNGNNPLTHLQSLQDNDGGFWWVKVGTSDFNNKAMTAYAVIALAGKSYPLGYYQKNTELPDGTYHLRIEGKNGTICDANVAGDTALTIVQNAASICNYSYNIENTSYGLYLQKINNEVGVGMSGWLYLVNSLSPSAAAADYILKKGDEVLWYYGEWGWWPTKLKAAKNNVATGEAVNTTVEYFDGQSWQPLAEAVIKGANQDYFTNSAGQVSLSLSDGFYNLKAEKSGYIRSNKLVVSVGSGIQQNVNMTVEVNNGTLIEGESIIFSVSPDKVDFGKMKPGEEKDSNITLANQGTVSLQVSAVVSGDNLFTDNLKLDDKIWAEFNELLSVNDNHPVKSSLKIPSSYLSSGVKSSELIFWAKSN